MLDRYHQINEEDDSAAEGGSGVGSGGAQEATEDWKHPRVLHSDASGHDCYERYRERTAPRCAVCGGAVLSKYFQVETEDGGSVKIHAEGDCHQRYKEKTAEKCLVCKGPVLDSYYEVGGEGKEGGGSPAGKVHAEGSCHRRWQESVAPRCAVCAKPIIGSSYKVGVQGADDDEEEGGGMTARVHAEGDCLARWKEDFQHQQEQQQRGGSRRGGGSQGGTSRHQ